MGQPLKWWEGSFFVLCLIVYVGVSIQRVLILGGCWLDVENEARFDE